MNIFQVFSFHFVAIGKALMPKNACVFGRAGVEGKVIWSLDKGNKWGLMETSGTLDLTSGMLLDVF